MDLSALLPPGRVLHDPDVLRSYSHDEAEWAPWSLPAAVVRPRTAAEVQTVVRHCAEHRIPVVTRGAGTGLSGGANATAGCVVIALDGMRTIKEINPLEKLAVVEPGVVNDDLRTACAEQDLWYPSDPASSPWSTIGGNVATNAGGVCCVKYGVTGDYVVGYFPSVVAAGHAVERIAAAGLTPSALELVDRQCLLAVDEWKNTGLAADADTVLLGRTDAPGQAGDAEAEALLACFDQAGATWSARSTTQQEADALFDARRLAYPALERLGPVLTEDICVPVGKVADMLARIQAIGLRHDTRIANIAHAGDGNLHPLLLTRTGDDDGKRRAQAAFTDIITEALELGGTVTGEHGVGLLKRHGLRQELAPPVLALHRAVRTAFDPHHILNPGKVFEQETT